MRISHDRPDLVIQVLPLGIKHDKGFNPKRVRVFYNNPSNSAGLVAKIPAG
jgi:hypothetical protein